MVELQPEKIEHKEIIFPANICFKNGNLFISNRTPGDDRPHVIYQYSPSLKLINSFGYMGRGPGEFLTPTLCNSPGSETLYISGYSDFSTKGWAVGDDGELIRVGNDININYTVNNVYVTGDNLFYYDIVANKIIKINIKDDCRIAGEIEMDLDIPVIPSGYFGANGSIVAFVHKFSNFIDLFESGTLKRIKRISANPSISPQTFDRQNSSNIIYGYLDVVVGADRIYALYSGKKSTDEDKSKYLEVFDNSGEPIMRCRLTERIDTFTVDEANSVVYGVNYMEPDSILVYRL